MWGLSTQPLKCPRKRGNAFTDARPGGPLVPKGCTLWKPAKTLLGSMAVVPAELVGLRPCRRVGLVALLRAVGGFRVPLGHTTTP